MIVMNKKSTTPYKKVSHHRKTSARFASNKRMEAFKHFGRNLEVYAFWTGFISTLISLIQVVVIAMK